VTLVQVRATDTELEQDESDLLTNAPDSKKEQLGFLRVRARSPFIIAVSCRTRERCFVLTYLVAQCIKGTNRLRPADQSSGSAEKQTVDSSPLKYSELSPVIYHESETELSSQVRVLAHSSHA